MDLLTQAVHQLALESFKDKDKRLYDFWSNPSIELKLVFYQQSCEVDTYFGSVIHRVVEPVYRLCGEIRKEPNATQGYGLREVFEVPLSDILNYILNEQINSTKLR